MKNKYKLIRMAASQIGQPVERHLNCTYHVLQQFFNAKLLMLLQKV